jgi:hypothetical protein
MAQSITTQMDTSLVLNLASTLADELGDSMSNQLAIKLLVSVSVLMAYSTEFFQSKSTVSDTFALVRRVVVLVLTTLVVKSVSPTNHQILGPGYQFSYEDRDGNISMAVWPIIERFLLSSILVIVAAFLSKQVNRRSRSIEMDRIMNSIQWIYADSLGSILTNRRVQRDFVIVGFIVMPQLLEISGSQLSSDAPDALDIWKQSLAMAWTNAIIGLVIPDSISVSNSGCDLVTILALACGLRAMGEKLIRGMGHIQWYIHWRISNIVILSLVEQGARPFDIFLAFATILFMIPVAERWIVVFQRPSQVEKERFKVSGLETINSIAATCLANSFSMVWMNTLRSLGAADNIAVALGTLALLQFVIHCTELKWVGIT